MARAKKTPVDISKGCLLIRLLLSSMAMVSYLSSFQVVLRLLSPASGVVAFILA
ncbi:hypothetical protein BDV30DRAFT_204473 [Aspergillus minisclerotigenes]|uniref:Uncharacterized protein n=1 Tax=Aspergillus minisclerotigenes TaxID=656917 RepID=A0A5N6JJE5_9EURO|nr:hypothetical protein BDV30DRAFT_204473 [Aspergillus minisclerotigenes]